MTLICRRLWSGEEEIKFCFAMCFYYDISQNTQKSSKFAATENQIKMNPAICTSYTEILKNFSTKNSLYNLKTSFPAFTSSPLTIKTLK